MYVRYIAYGFEKMLRVGEKGAQQHGQNQGEAKFPRFPHWFMFAHGDISESFNLVRISERVLEHGFLTSSSVFPRR